MNTKKVSGLDHLVLEKSKVFHLGKHLTQFVVSQSMASAQCCTHPCLSSSGNMIISYGAEGYYIMCTLIHCLPMQFPGEAISGSRYLPLTVVGCALFPMKLKSKAHEALSLLFQQDGVSSAIICGNSKEII